MKGVGLNTHRSCLERHHPLGNDCPTCTEPHTTLQPSLFERYKIAVFSAYTVLLIVFRVARFHVAVKECGIKYACIQADALQSVKEGKLKKHPRRVWSTNKHINRDDLLKQWVRA